MRPIDKGTCPIVDGQPKVVSDYKDWRYDLIGRIGYYCVYCNMPLSHQLHVEHVVPKKPLPNQPAGNLLAWENMLLSCEKCNKAKSNKRSDDTVHYLPESHNTLLPFQAVAHVSHPSAMIIAVKTSLNSIQKDKANRTIDDFEWENIDTRGAIVDIRWMRRYDSWVVVKANRTLLDLAKASPTYNADAAGRLIAIQAITTGFFLLWFEEFSNEPEVLKWLIHPDLFKGVAQNCFDSSNGYKPIPRNPTNQADPI